MIRLAWQFLWARPWVAALNLAMLALGVAAMTLVIQVSHQLGRAVVRDLSGIDLVVGAKGSPLQIILAGVFHLDVPTGNLPLATVAALRAHPLVEQVVPLSLGDSLAGHRIVGTEPAYLAFLGLQLARGQLWSQPLQAVLGAETARSQRLDLGDTFSGSHGLGREGEVHGHRPYRVSGVLSRCGCAADRLVLTSLESVWAVHEAETALDDEDRAALAAEREVTLLLLRYRSPLAAISVPRWVQAQDGLQAAAPALESARLLRMVGVGAEVLKGFGLLVLAVAGASVFLALLSAVRERQGDLAMLRMLGAPPRRLALLLLAEAGWLAGLGWLLGTLVGQGLTHLLGWWLAAEQSVALSGAGWADGQGAVAAAVVALALLAAALPAWRAARLDVSLLLQAPR